MKISNPFHRNRAEQMGESMWKFYVEQTPFVNLLGEQPLVFEGSRGSGKTMFFLCNSWREKFSEYNELKKPLIDLFNEDSIIGLYYKVDGKFVGNNLSGKYIESHIWKGIFNTYFNVVVSKDILFFLQECVSYSIFNEILLKQILERIAKKLRKNYSTDLINCEFIIDCFDEILDLIERFANNPEMELPILLGEGTLIKDILERLRNLDVFSKTRFHVFIDEFEELNESQQKSINTLIKQSVYWLVYDIGVKTGGRLMPYTSSESMEIVREKDDYRLWQPEKQLFERNPDSYLDFLKLICKKRLENFEMPLGNNERFAQYTTIDFYLKQHEKLIELNEFKKSDRYTEVKSRLVKIIEDDYNRNENFDYNNVLNELVENVQPDIMRMHLAILHRKNLTVLELYNNAINKTHKYKEWCHNTLTATLYLLCKELDITKKYSGLETFALLSSGVIRSFLELCESAFEYAFSEGFTFASPRPLTLSEQTEAAHYVSQLKVERIEGLVPNGAAIKRFLLALGRIFYHRQTNPFTTLGEPEPNHFTTSMLSLSLISTVASERLNHAVMHNVLQIHLPTKQKNSGQLETSDYQLNRIYCPYLKISHRKKRKLQIDAHDIATLLIGKKQDVDRVIRKLSASKTDSDTPTLFDYDISGEI